MNFKEFMEEMKKLPNQITMLRVLLYPVLIYFAYTRRVNEFSITFIFMLFTDLLDGYIARKYDICSDFGNNLDSYSDELIFFSAIPIMYLIVPQKFLENMFIILLTIALVIISRSLSAIKFKYKFKLHIWSNKVANFFLYPVLVYVIYFDKYHVVFYSFLAIAIFSQIEEILIFLTYRKPDNNVKSYFFPKLNKGKKWIKN